MSRPFFSLNLQSAFFDSLIAKHRKTWQNMAKHGKVSLNDNDNDNVNVNDIDKDKKRIYP